MDLEKTILGFIKAGHVVKLRRLHQSTGAIIAPAVIPAAEDGGGSPLPAGDGVCTVTAHIVEGPDLVVFASDEEDGESGYVDGLIGAWLGELGYVC